MIHHDLDVNIVMGIYCNIKYYFGRLFRVCICF